MLELMLGDAAVALIREARIETVCRVCGWGTISSLDPLCIDCREIRQWSQTNRAFCSLLHRDRAETAV